jgi:hypothetical protein
VLCCVLVDVDEVVITSAVVVEAWDCRVLQEVVTASEVVVVDCICQTMYLCYETEKLTDVVLDAADVIVLLVVVVVVDW